MYQCATFCTKFSFIFYKLLKFYRLLHFKAMYGCFILDYRMISSEDTPWIAESGGDPDSGGCSYCRFTPAQTSYPSNKLL